MDILDRIIFINHLIQGEWNQPDLILGIFFEFDFCALYRFHTAIQSHIADIQRVTSINYHHIINNQIVVMEYPMRSGDFSLLLSSMLKSKKGDDIKKRLLIYF